MQFRSKDISEMLQKNGGFIPGVRPGSKTEEFLSNIVDRLSLIGGLYVTVICLLPAALLHFFNVPFYFGGFLTPSKGRRSQGLDLKNMNIKDIYKVNKKNEMIPIIDEYINNILNECSTRKGLSIFFINGMHLDLILTKSQKFLPSNTQIAICSELTRAEEKINRGTSSELKNILQENQELKSGEHVIIFYINKI
jgi:16S rRNA C1402 (ribose-2'-O) methylase RsmI